MNRQEVIQLLLSESPRNEAAYLALLTLGEARTSEVADFLGQDHANTRRRLDALEAAGRVRVVREGEVAPSGRGRPSRVWAAV